MKQQQWNLGLKFPAVVRIKKVLKRIERITNIARCFEKISPYAWYSIMFKTFTLA